jgi:hypothetical protein
MSIFRTSQIVQQGYHQNEKGISKGKIQNLVSKKDSGKTT